MQQQTRTPKFVRRKRNPAPLVIAAIILLVFGCWVFNKACGGGKETGTSDLSGYLNSVRPIIEASTDLGRQWNSMLASLTELVADPDGLNEQLRVIEEQSGELLDQARGLEVPVALESAHPALLICLEQRYRAMKKYRPDLINSLQAIDLQTYARSLAEDMQEIMYSDGSYLFFKRAVESILAENDIADTTLPDSRWLENFEQATVSRVENFLMALKGTEVHGLALGTVSFNPAGSIKAVGGEQVHFLPEAEQISVTVNVENQGTRTEKDVAVSLSLYADTSSPTRQEQTIPSINPGETIAVEFTGLVPAGGGVRNSLEIKVAPVPQEAFIENNNKLIYFVIE